MKTVTSMPFIAIAILLMVTSGCNKERPIPDHGINIQTPSLNTAPIPNAGNDQYVFFPANFCTLNGAVQDLENNIQTILWSKISGPSSFLIEQPSSLSTKVSNLQIGIYQFELTVTDNMGMYEKDTIGVTVREVQANTNETILQNQIWIFPWYSAVEVKDFYNLIPPGSVFKIFIRRDTNPDWVEVYPISYYVTSGPYEYFIETRPGGAGIYTYGSLYIFYYSLDVSDTPDVKIEF